MRKKNYYGLKVVLHIYFISQNIKKIFFPGEMYNYFIYFENNIFNTYINSSNDEY